MMMKMIIKTGIKNGDEDKPSGEEMSLQEGLFFFSYSTVKLPNDSEGEMRELSSWVHEVEEEAGKTIPLHVTRFFPRSDYSNRQPTPVEKVYHLAEVARERLEYVFEGNC